MYVHPTHHQFPRIRCAICDRLVDRVEWGTSMHEQKTWIDVWCHGDKDTMEIRSFELMRMSREQIEQLNSQVGVAFTTPRIAQEKAPDREDRG